MSNKAHQQLAEVLHGLEGMVIISGYPCALNDRLYGDWERHEREHMADQAKARLEVVWLNPACSARLAADRSQLELLEAVI